MEKLILEPVKIKLRNKAIIWCSHHVFLNGKFCLSNLMSCYDKVTRLVDERKVIGVIILDISRAFDTVPHSILLDRMKFFSLPAGARGLAERSS